MKDQDSQYLAAIVRDSDDAIIGKSLEGIITSWNVGAQRIYGYTADEAIGRTIAILVPPDRQDELPDILQKLARDESVNHYETLRVAKDGRLVNMSLTLSPIHDASGAVVGASSIGRDVTREKEAEAALRESAKAYKLLMEQASDAILVSYPDHPLIDVNQRASDMLGYSREELLQLRGENNALPDGLSALTLGSDEIQVGDTVYAERAVRRKDGTVIVTELSTRQLDDRRILTIARDITTRKKAEEVLRENEAQLRSAIDIAQLSAYEWDPRTGMLTWDTGMNLMWGLSSDTPVDFELFLAGVHPDDRDSMQAAITRSNTPGGDGRYTAEYRVIGQRDNQVRWVSVRGQSFFEGDIAVRQVGVAQDITERKRAEVALATSEANLRALFAAMSDVVLVLDAQGRYLQIAPTNPALLYKPAADVLGQTIHDVLPAADADNILQVIRLTLEKQQPVHFEYGLSIGDTRIWFDATVSPMGDDKVFWIARDVTERRLAEEAIASERYLLNSLMDSTPDSIYFKDRNSKFTRVNRALAESVGLSGPAEAIGKSDFDLFSKELASLSYTEEQEIIRTGQPILSSEEREVWPDGHVTWVLSTKMPLRDVQGNITGIFGVSRQITERKQAEEALRTSEQKFRAIFENTLEAVFITDDKGTFVDVNHAATTLAGLSAGELVGRNYTEIRTWKPTAQLGLLQDPVTGEGEANGDLQFVSASGEIREIEYFSKLNFIPGYNLSVAHDHTERRRTEEARLARDAAERANHAKSEFLSRMSHELRTPLNAILGFGQLLQMDSPSSEQAESVGYILKAGQHLLGLINEVLDIARIEDGKIDFSIEPVSVSDVLQVSLNLVQPMAAHRNIDMKTDLASSSNCYVMADHQRLQQVLLNLLANAIKYNREGGEVHVSCSDLSYEADGLNPQNTRPRSRIRIAVSDTGPGLAPGDVERLFTPFERLGAEQSDVEGTGLGLALSKHLVEAMGGVIGVDSEPGTGSTFWVELAPAVEHLPGDDLLATGSLLDIQLREQVHTILYIEDNLSNLRLIERILRKRPEVNLITAMQGQMGLDMAFEHMPDLILLDLHLPDMTGNDVLRHLREDHRTASIPVVVLSADASPRQADKLLEAGAQAYLTKPIDVEQLLRVLGEATAPVKA